jgi:hypothetical protein
MRWNHIGTSLAVAALLCASDGAMAAQRTFVETTGTDNPSCTIAAPCRTFAAAIAAASSGGEVIVLDSGGYGAVTIGKSVSIIASPGIYAGVSVPSGDGITIAGSGITVVMRGLSVNGQGGNNGITINSAANVRIEGCVVSNMAANGILHNDGYLYVEDTTVRNNANIGIWSTSGLAQANFDRVRVEENADGIRAQNGAQAVVHDSVVTHNSSVGIFAYVTDTSLQNYTFVIVSHSLVSYNNVGIQSHSAGSGGAYASISDNTIERNAVAGVLATQAGANSLLYLRGNTVSDTTSGIDVHVTSGASGLFDGNYMLGVLIDSGGNADSVGNNYVSSSCCVAPGHLSSW